MAIYVSEPGRPTGTRVPEVFRDRPVGSVTEMVEGHRINPNRSDAIDPEVLNAQWPSHSPEHAAAQYQQSGESEPEPERAFLPAKTLASANLVTIDASATLAEGLAEMSRHSIRHLVVQSDQVIAGLVDRLWIVSWLLEQQRRAEDYTFNQIELPSFLTATPETDGHLLARLMLAHQLDAALLINREGGASGIVTSADFLRLYADAQRQESNV